MKTFETLRPWIYVCLFAAALGPLPIPFIKKKAKNLDSKWFTASLVGLVLLAAFCIADCLVLPALQAPQTRQKVLSADEITVQEKYISEGTFFRSGDPYIVLTDGEDTVAIQVTEGIYNKYKPGDVYEHDADTVQYASNPAAKAGDGKASPLPQP